jgi:hypothetical protein
MFEMIFFTNSNTIMTPIGAIESEILFYQILNSRIGRTNTIKKDICYIQCV